MSQLPKMLADALRADAARHERGDFVNVGKEFDLLEEYRREHAESQSDETIRIAHRFWDSWIDQVRHGFAQNFYNGISAGMWPLLAREIALALDSGGAVTNALVLKHFDGNRSESSKS
ncbi:MAG TPA: hypothetical protein V6C97_01775 [Oculatellaceae cyanobacterium]